MSNKSLNWMILFFLLFSVFSSMFVTTPVIAPINPKGGTIVGDSVIWENEIGRLEVWPHTATGLITQVQYAKVKWKWPDNNIDVAFRFEEALSKADIWMWQNISHDVKVPKYEDVPYTYILSNIAGFSPIEEPEEVDWGDIPSDNYYTGTFDNSSSVDIGFDSFEWLNPEHTSAEFTYHLYEQNGTEIEEQYWFDWNSKKDVFQHTVYNGKHYYYATNIPMKQDKSYRFKWQYDIPLGTSGKFDFLAKLSGEALSFALENDRYICIDPWYSSDYTYYRTITIESDYVTSTLTNFPLMVAIPDATADKMDDGRSLNFLTSEDSGELYFEIEKWADNEDRIVWVNVTSIAHDADTVLYCYYNNTDVVESAYNSPSDVWDGNFVVVYHFNESSGNLVDSTANNNDGTAVGGTPDYRATGRVGYCVDLDGTADYLDVDNDLGLRQSDFTYELMFNWEDATVGNALWCATYHLYGDSGIYGMYPLNSPMDFGFRRLISSTSQFTVVEDNPVSNRWYVTAWRYDNDGNSVSYLNGSMVNTDGNTGDIDSTSGINRIGGNWGDPAPNMAYLWDGKLDEIRISDTLRSEAYVTASFHAINESTHNGTFLTWGAEQIEPLVNHAPSVSGITPANHSTEISLTPNLYVTCTDSDGNPINVTWGSNSSGEWIKFAENNSIATGTTITQPNTNITDENTDYYWNITIWDGNGSAKATYWYHFKTTYGGKLYVDADQIASWYNNVHVKTIAEARSNSTSGDTIYIYAGTYAETGIDIDRTLTIIGNSSDTVTIGDAGSVDVDIFELLEDNIHISNIKFTDQNERGITISSANDISFKIENCVFDGVGESLIGEAFYPAILLEGNVNGIIRNCTFTNSGSPIIFDEVGCDDDGYSEPIEIYNNTFTQGTIDDSDSIAIYISANRHTTLIYDNTIRDYANEGGGYLPAGIHLEEVLGEPGVGVSNVSIYDNIIENNRYGIVIDVSVLSSNITIYNNALSNSDNTEIAGSPYSPDIYWNTTLIESENILGGTWTGGNFWNDYTGVDADGDGIGDTTYEIASGDEHPLVINPPENVTTDYDGNYSSLNLTWDLGENSNTVVVIRNSDHYPTSATDGTEVANTTNGFSNISGVTTWNYYTLFGYSSNATNYSKTGVNISWGAMVINVYNESDMTQAITNWHILIKNSEGTLGYQRRNNNNPFYIGSDDVPYGTNSLIKVWKESYHFRIQIVDIPEDEFSSITFYLPREKLEPGQEEGETESTDCVLRGYLDSVFVSNPAVDAEITLTYPLESIITVEIYDNDLYGTHGDWLTIPNANFTATETKVTITAATLDSTTSMARVNYYFEDCTGEIISSLYFIRIVESYETSSGFYDRPVENVKVTFQRFNNQSKIFVDVHSQLTDANGYVNVYLFPSVNYQVLYEKSDYEDGLSDYVPPAPNEYGQTVEKTFRIIKIIEESEPSITVYKDSFLVSPYNSTAFIIYYRNLNENNSLVEFDIYDHIGNVLVDDYAELDFPNNITLYVNFSSYSLTGDMIRVEALISRAAGGQLTLTKYFNIQQAREPGSASMAPLMAIFSIGVCLFGVTIAHPKKVFGFVGIITMIIALALTAFVTPEWYIHLIQSVEIILLIIIFLIFREEGVHAV